MHAGPDASREIDARLAALEARVDASLRPPAPTGAQPAVPAGPAPVAAAPPSPRTGKDIWDRLAAFLPLLNGLVLAMVGYWLTGAVNEGFKRQELQLANAREMRELLRTLQGGDTTLEDAQASAFALAAFGAPAVPPLLGALSAGGDTRAPAAEAALRLVGLSDPGAVCRPALQVLDNRSGRFSWLTHQAALRLVADLQCADSDTVLDRYAPLVENVRTPEQLAPLQDALAAIPPVDLIAVEELRTEFLRARRFAGGRAP